MDNMRYSAFLFAVLSLSGCTEAQPHPSEGQPIKSIYWSDGDSGRLTLLSGEVIKFRLKDVDAPETGGVGSIGGAKCELERELGYKAKAFMVETTDRYLDNQQKLLAVSSWFAIDRYERQLIHISVYPKPKTDPSEEGINSSSKQSDESAVRIAQLAISEGHLAQWNYDDGALKPHWCPATD